MLVVGGPGFVDDVRSWVEILGINALVTLMLMGLTAHVVLVWTNNWEPYRSILSAQRWRAVASATVGVSVLGGLAGLIAIMNGPGTQYRWTHPTMPGEEQGRVTAECRMMATGEVDVVGRTNRERGERLAQRNSYFSDCLRSRGFERVPIQTDDG